MVFILNEIGLLLIMLCPMWFHGILAKIDHKEYLVNIKDLQKVSGRNYGINNTLLRD